MSTHAVNKKSGCTYKLGETPFTHLTYEQFKNSNIFGRAKSPPTHSPIQNPTHTPMSPPTKTPIITITKTPTKPTTRPSVRPTNKPSRSPTSIFIHL